MPFLPTNKTDVDKDPKQTEQAHANTRDAVSKYMEDLRRLLEQQVSAREVAKLIAKSPRHVDEMMAYVHQVKGSHFAAQVAQELRQIRHLSSFLPRGQFDDGTVGDPDDGTVTDSPAPQVDDGTVDAPIYQSTPTADDGTVDTAVSRPSTPVDDGTINTPVRVPTAHGTRRKPPG